MTVTVRFAPSPTGRLHLGNARTGLVNWLFARARGGRFLLRLDDTDRERSTAAFAQSIEDDLRWLGLDWDAFARQSDRFDRYEAAAERLKAAGRLYPCFETTEELELKRKLLQARGRPPVYDRAALLVDDAERARRIAAGERPHWRFKLDHRPLEWQDLVRGPVAFHGANLSDPVLIRADGLPLYTVSSVVDDIELGITHIIRGEDHVANTAVQIDIFEALGGSVPSFAHLALIADAEGDKLSKRAGSLGLDALAADGIEAMTVASLLAKLGTADPIEPRLSLADLVAEFDISRFGRSQPHLDPADLTALNAKLLHVLAFDAVSARLPADATEAFWLAVRPNLERLVDAALWWRVVEGPLEPVIGGEDAAFITQARNMLPEGPIGPDTWKGWTDRIKDATGRKGKALFLPLRLALTGQEHGPEMARLLPLIGADRVRARLDGSAA